MRVARAVLAHIIALSEGGKNDIDNFVMAHDRCNSAENDERSKQQS
jgi:5-methylcytosine-specific restriction endonuclease McrA